MMRRCLVIPAVALATLWVLAPVAAAADFRTGEEVTVAEILADPEAYGAVVVQGELVGDFGRRGDGTVWAQLNGDSYTEFPLREGGSLAGANLGIGVRIPSEVWPGLDQPGGYRFRGPMVELQGTWRYHDPSRGGESYLDVTGVKVLEPARPLAEPMEWVPLGLGVGLAALALGVGRATRRRRR